MGGRELGGNGKAIKGPGRGKRECFFLVGVGRLCFTRKKLSLTSSRDMYLTLLPLYPGPCPESSVSPISPQTHPNINIPFGDLRFPPGIPLSESAFT